VSAYVQNARGIAPDSSVSIAGLQVGKVTGIVRNGPDAILTLRIDRGPTPLPVDSRVQVRLRTVAGEADVQLLPGHSKQLVTSGGSLGLSQDQPFTDVDQILNQLSPPTEGHTRQFVQGLGAGVAGEGPHLNHVLGQTASVISDSLPLTSTLAAQHNQVADIVQNLGAVMNAVGQRTQAVEQFAHGARLTFQAIAARDVALRATLDQLPSALRSFRNATDSIGANTPQIAPVLTALAGAVSAVSPAIHRLAPAARSGIDLVNALGQASPPLRNVLGGLETLQRPARAALPEVHATTCQLDPMLRYIAPYGRDIASALADFGGFASPYATTGHSLLVDPYVNPTTFLRGGVVDPAVNTALQALLNFGAFSKLGPNTGYDAMPGPGGINNGVIGRGATGPASFGKLYKFPHVTPDCAK
jgi:phospholipid/cholesterol/gamma-HCH transport system substrate-binding protein